MNDVISSVIAMLFAWVPYVAVAWGYKALTAGDATTFWYALGALIAARLFFSIIETLGSILAWRVYGKRRAVRVGVADLRANNFPKRAYREEPFSSYLERIEEEPEFSDALKKSARQYQIVKQVIQLHVGLFANMRMNAAAEAAFELYSPKSAAPTMKELQDKWKAEHPGRDGSEF